MLDVFEPWLGQKQTNVKGLNQPRKFLYLTQSRVENGIDDPIII